MRSVLIIAGVVVLALGLLWIGQGMGWILWPKSSFMLNQPRWSWYGTAQALAGLSIIWFAWR
jgi:drug/metabolite transporter superfamily protein YnfA